MNTPLIDRDKARRGERVTNIDLTAAKNAAREALETTTTWSPMHCVDVIVDAALPHILAQVEAHVMPTQDEIVRIIWTAMEVAREHEEKMDRLLEGEWQAGYVAGNNDQLNGTICGRRRAANEGIARGGEQND